MSDTNITITGPLKAHLELIRDEIRDQKSLDATIQSILDTPIPGEYDVADATTTDDPAGIKVSEETLAWLDLVKEQDGYSSTDDLLRAKSGATARDKGEEPVEWKPL
jgi:hypothetical protein